MSFFKNLSRIIPEILELDEVKKPSLGFFPSRPLHLHEQYLKDSFLALGEVDVLLIQLNHSAILLANFRSTKALKKNKISRYDYIVYHIEGYLLRVTGILDRVLILVNIVLNLKIKHYKCKASYMLVDDNKKSGIAGVIKDIDAKLFNELLSLSAYIDMFREDRNQIAHSKRISYQDLSHIEAYCIVSHDDVTGEFTKWAHLFKREADKKVMEYKNDFIKCSDKINSLLQPIFASLENHFNLYYLRSKATVAPLTIEMNAIENANVQ
jgi:hypothetical protein